MTKRLFWQIAALILIAGAVYLAVRQYEFWQARRIYDSSMERTARPANGLMTDEEARKQAEDDFLNEQLNTSELNAAVAD